MSRRPRVRAEAARVIADVVGRGRNLDRALMPALEAIEDRRDKAFLQAICYGVVRFYPRLDRILAELLERPLRPRDIQLRTLILAGLYQISSMDVPDHAAVAESVDAAVAIRRPRAKGLVNAVLRRYARERLQIDARVMETPEGRWSHPPWIVERLMADWPDAWEGVLTANNEPPPMWLRVNRSKIDRDAYLKGLAQEASAGSCAPESVLLRDPVPVEGLAGFAEGMVSVQDAAAQLAAHLLGACPGERVLDACSAPGGKAAHVLELCPQVELDALEIDEGRLTSMRATFDRLDLRPRVIHGDASCPEDWWDGSPYDRILVDAPCTASGVIRRHPDIKLLRRESDISRLAGHQGQILDRLWPLLRPGGRLLYATCSVFREENQNQVVAFLDRTADASQGLFEENPGWGVVAGPGRQVLPGEAGMDGFYYACLIKAP
ncbi:MAG: hypothetical protein AMJ59_18385 [Gammaproteobacteria bacterium SG8_31]|nr:MAG: hypothetical protein AMJ59_18385 [Gammaproteobacteria bacterium SG8_31]